MILFEFTTQRDADMVNAAAADGDDGFTLFKCFQICWRHAISLGGAFAKPDVFIRTRIQVGRYPGDVS